LGGKVTVEKTADPSVIRIVVLGPSAAYMEGGVDTLSPYSLAASSGDGVYYNSMHITGRGVRYTKIVHRLVSGATSVSTIEELGTTIENPFLNSLSLAYDVGVRAAQTYAGPNHQMSAATGAVPVYTDLLGARIESQGTVFRVQDVTVDPSGESVAGRMDTTIADFNTVWTGKTFAEFNALWTGYTFGTFATSPLLTNLTG
jgi:hypothetical protein